MYASPSRIPENARAEIGRSLDALLADGLDLHGQIKVAHWNVKGPGFAALHPLFETFAIGLAAHNDVLAERAVTLGAVVHGTARHVARVSTLPDYPAETRKDLEHVALLAERFEIYLDRARDARAVAERHADQDTADALTAVVRDFEKHAWFLGATLER